jgi:hypothetical protein
MHTANELTSSAFGIEVGGRDASLNEVFPGFTDRDRLGVVVRRPCGATGASAVILAAVTAFYDTQRDKHGSGEFFIYPDYFVFHVGQRWGEHGMLDIWPSHKEIVVGEEPEELLQAINDRAITLLLVEDRPPGEPSFERESLASARDRITSALAYSAYGRVSEADVRIAGNGVAESYVAAVLERSQAPEELSVARSQLRAHGRAVETYRRLTLDEALARL